MAKKTQVGPFMQNVGGATREQIQAFFQQQMQLFGPALSALAQSAVIQGNRMESQLSASLGRAGIGGSTGGGALLRGIGSTYAAQAVQQERMKAIMQAITNANALATPLGQEFVGIRQQEIASRDRPGGTFGGVMSAIGSLVGAGADVMSAMGKGNLPSPSGPTDFTGQV